jgi:hypothetical protein
MLLSNFDICTDRESMSMSFLTNQRAVGFRFQFASGKEMAFRRRAEAVED